MRYEHSRSVDLYDIESKVWTYIQDKLNSIEDYRR